MIFRHPDGSFRRYAPAAGPVTQKKADGEYENGAHWRQVDGAPRGVQIHRDGKTMRNIAPVKP